MTQDIPTWDGRPSRLLDTPAEILDVGRLSLCVDPRMELLAIVQWLSSYGTRFSLLTRLDFDYKADVIASFEPYRDHGAVRQLDAMLDRPASREAPPFAFAAPPEAMLYVRPDFTVAPAIDADAFLVGRAGGRAALDAFVDALRDFYESAGFPAFVEYHRSAYREILARTRRKLGVRDEIDRLEAFYGLQQGSYTVILVPLYHSVGFGPHLVARGVRHIYSILGPLDTVGGLPDFGSESYFRYMQRHEFSHSFINPLTDAHWAEAQRYFADCDSQVETQELVNESVIRAVTTWFAYEDEGPARGDEALQRELDRGFPAVPSLLTKLRRYASNRERYPTIDAFYPELLRTFENRAFRSQSPNA